MIKSRPLLVSLADSEVASVANFATERFGAKGSALTAKDIVKLRAAE